MKRPETHDEFFDALTDEEHAALGAFDDLVESTCAPDSELPEDSETKERFMNPTRWSIVKLAAAASIIAAILSVVDWSGPEEFDPRFDAHPLMSLVVPQEKAGPRMVLLVGLGELAGSKTPRLEYQSGRIHHRPPAGNAQVPPTDEFTEFAFDLEKANAQRQAAIAAGKTSPGTYRPGQSYQLQDKDRPMPVYWKPWAPGRVAEKKGVKIEAAVNALKAARKGEAFDADLVMGGWVYAPPRWYGAQKRGFTEQDFMNAKRATDNLGNPAVSVKVNPKRSDEFKKFTGELVGCSMCLVVDDMVWSNPTVREPLDSAIQITGGGGGFADAEQEYILRAFLGGGAKKK